MQSQKMTLHVFYISQKYVKNITNKNMQYAQK